MKLDPGERTARLSTKEDVRFDRALLGTGANVRRLRVDGADLDGIHYLRAFANSDAIRADADAAGRVVIVGGSYIACEVAATLAARGATCTMVMQEEATLERSFGPEIGRFFQRVLEEHGVSVLAGDELERLEGDGERVQRVVTAGGQELDCGAVVIGAGVMPDVMLARQAKLDLGEGGGILCSSGSRRARRGSSPPVTRPSTTPPCTGSGSASSTGTSPASRARPPRSTCSDAGSRTRACPTSGQTLRTGCH
jgi:NAD(P)H-nitrite reductase